MFSGPLAKTSLRVLPRFSLLRCSETAELLWHGSAVSLIAFQVRCPPVFSRSVMFPRFDPVVGLASSLSNYDGELAAGVTDTGDVAKLIDEGHQISRRTTTQCSSSSHHALLLPDRDVADGVEVDAMRQPLRVNRWRCGHCSNVPNENVAPYFMHH